MQLAAGIEEVPPGSAVTVRPGDVVIYVDNQVAQTLRNTGDDWARAISVGVFSTAPPSPLVVGAVSSEDWERSGLFGHNLLVTVERLTLAPGASLPAFTPDVRAPRVFAVIEGVAHQATRVSAGAATPSRPVSFYESWAIWFTPLDAGEQLQLRNDEDRPLVLLEVTVSSADAATTVAATPLS